MLKHTLLLLFLYGIRSGDCRPQSDLAEARKEIERDRFKKSELGANGSGAAESGNGVINNFRNPVLEYLAGEDRAGKRNGVFREIRHGQTLLLPNGNLIVRSSVPQAASGNTQNGDPGKEMITNLREYVKNRGTPEGFVTSPTLQLTKNDSGGEWTKTEVFPATAIVVSTYNPDGTIKSSATHFHPSVNFGAPWTPIGSSVVHSGSGSSAVPWGPPSAAAFGPGQRINWPFAGYFPLVINDPLLAAYNGLTSGVYNAFSSVVEYGPEADICRKKDQAEKIKTVRKEIESGIDEVRLNADLKLLKSSAGKTDDGDEFSNIFDEVVVEAEKPRTSSATTMEKKKRTIRDTTGIVVDFKNGERVNVQVEEPNRKSLPRRLGQSDLVLRKGGIAIAGPGGAATAYTGGTAIVGPYGTVYKSPEGRAILGPYSRVVNITDDMSFEEILKLHLGQRREGIDRKAAPGRRFKNFKGYFSYLTDLPVEIENSGGGGGREADGAVVTLSEGEIEKKLDEVHKEGFAEAVDDEKVASSNETLLVFRPKARAEAGREGIALSSPISHAVIFPNRKTNIRYDPEAVASAGPGGFAHAYSDLFLSYLRRRDVFLPAEPEQRTRAHSVMLVNPPPLSSIPRPSHTGFNAKKKVPKPQVPDKEGSEGSGEDVGEEPEQTTNQGSGADGVAVSPPPDGASVAEAKPVGLAIAGRVSPDDEINRQPSTSGPGGVAAAKPQGTAVAGPGGLAIARPIGTAIAGVEVEGSVPLGGSQKNKKKKPKQDPEKADDQSDTELHYVGGLTGPIGNPQPNTKDFGPGIVAKSRNHDNLIFQGKFNGDGYQLKLGEQDGKYGFYPMMVSPQRLGSDRIQKRMDAPTFFHGLLGNKSPHPQGPQTQIYPGFYI